MCHCGAARESDTHLDVVEQAKIVLCGEQTDSLRPVTPPLSIMRMRHSHARRLFESFASRVERLRSIDLAVARTPARTCVSAIDPKASTESWRYQTSPLSLGSDHQSSREGTDCLLSISQPFKSCRHPSLVSFPPRPWKPPVRSNIGVSLAFSPLRRPPASKTT